MLGSEVTRERNLFEEAGIKVELFKNREATFKAPHFPGTSRSVDQRGQI